MKVKQKNLIMIQMTFDNAFNQGFSKRHQSKEVSLENTIREYKNKTPV